MRDIYRIRYLVEPWNKPRPAGGRKVADNVTLSDDDHGYCDQILVASIMCDNETGEPASVALFDSESGCGRPPREMLEMVRDQIDHYLEHHCD